MTRNEYTKDWYDNKGGKEWYHQYYLTNQKSKRQTVEYRKRNAKLSQEWRDRNPKHLMLGNAKARAKNFNIEFSITVDDYDIPSLCPVLNIPIFRIRGKQTDNSPALDRIDNSKGYIPGNVRVISHKANRMKSNLTIDILEKLLRYMKGEL